MKLVGLSAHWSAATIDTLNQTKIWDFRFFSPERRRIFLVNVTLDKEVSGQAHLYKVKGTNKPSIINPDDWIVDSDEAILTWLNQGGGFFLETFPGSQVQVIFRQPPSRPGNGIGTLTIGMFCGTCHTASRVSSCFPWSSQLVKAPKSTELSQRERCRLP